MSGKTSSARIISPTMGIPLVLGRGFGPQDTDKSQKVAVISETMAQRFFPNGSPLGKRFGIEGPESSDEIEIIGVVKDAKYRSSDRGVATDGLLPALADALDLSTTLWCVSPARRQRSSRRYGRRSRKSTAICRLIES